MTLKRQVFAEKLDYLKNQVAENLAKSLQQEKPRSLYEPMKYTIQAGGKRLRPILLLLAAETLGGDIQAALPAASAVELLHNFTLVHDDIMDEDDTRRGRPTVHQKWDTDIALLAGDGLVALAYRSLLQTPSDRLTEIAHLFTSGIIELCEGQALDREFETRDHVSMDEYMQMIRKKTACLLSMCAQIGGMIAQGSRESIRALKVFGESLGIAFQIQDDLLDITSDQATLGKDFGSDIRQRKKTFLLVDALNNSSQKQIRFLHERLSQDGIELNEILQIRELFEETGAIRNAKQMIRKYIASAEKSLMPLNNHHGNTENLKAFLNLVLKRRA